MLKKYFLLSVLMVIFFIPKNTQAQEDELRTFLIQTDLSGDASGPVSQVSFQDLEWAYRYASQRLQKNQDAFNQTEITSDLTQAFGNRDKKETLRTHMILLQVMVGNLAEVLLQKFHELEKTGIQLDYEVENRLNQIREKRAIIVRNMVKKKALHQTDKDPFEVSLPKKYTEFVQISKDLFESLKKNEMDLAKNLFEIQNQIDEFWKSYSKI